MAKTHEEMAALFKEQLKIVSDYEKYLKGSLNDFQYTRKELRKALTAVLYAANKQQQYRDYKYNKRVAEQAIERQKLESESGFDNIHLNTKFADDPAVPKEHGTFKCDTSGFWDTLSKVFKGDEK